MAAGPPPADPDLPLHPSLTPATTLSLSPSIQVERPDGSTFFAVLTSRFHKKLWVKRGGFLIVDTPDEATGGGDDGAPSTSTKGPGKVAGVIAAILYEADVRRLKGMAGVWPPEFDEGGGRADEEKEQEVAPGGGGGGADPASPASSSGGLPPLEANPNQRRFEHAYSEEEEE